MQTAYIIDAMRSPVGKYGGSLATVRPDDLLATVIKNILQRNAQVITADIDEVIMGDANQAGEDNRNVARMSLLLAGLPFTVPGYTVNRLCASGLQSIMNAYMQIASGNAELVLAGGVESMTRAPLVMAKSSKAWDRAPEIYDTTIGWRFTNPALSNLYYPYTMGETAENVAEKWNISRVEQDEFAYNSQLKFSQAQAALKFNNEITPIAVDLGRGKTLEFAVDEHPRLSEMEVLSGLKPAFKKDGTVTAANSSGVNDGAAVLILASEAAVKKYNLSPIARLVSAAAVGVEPKYMGIGPVPATLKALEKAGLKTGNLDLIELNEAFAAQSVACMRDLDLNPEIVNVNGGSIAIGHPLGASGARISTTLLHEMQKRNNVKYGLATMCVGVGQGSAIIYEKL